MWPTLLRQLMCLRGVRDVDVTLIWRQIVMTVWRQFSTGPDKKSNPFSRDIKQPVS